MDEMLIQSTCHESGYCGSHEFWHIVTLHQDAPNKLRLRVVNERSNQTSRGVVEDVDVAEYQISARELEQWILEHGQRVK